MLYTPLDDLVSATLDKGGAILVRGGGDIGESVVARMTEALCGSGSPLPA